MLPDLLPCQVDLLGLGIDVSHGFSLIFALGSALADPVGSLGCICRRNVRKTKVSRRARDAWARDTYLR